MDRVARSVGVGGGRPAFGGNDPAGEWQGARLRPTGVVVFATVEQPAPGGPWRSVLDVASPPELTAGRDAGASAPGVRRRGPSPTRSVAGHDWRHLALRPMAWLLGR